MKKSETIELISKTWEKDKDGIPRVHASSRTVFCHVRSATATEVFTGRTHGLKPEKMFSIFSEEYMGETTIRYDSDLYSVYRTYRKGLDILELHTELKEGEHAEPTYEPKEPPETEPEPPETEPEPPESEPEPPESE